MTVRPRRSVLYMPGSNARALEKAKTLPADAVILDLEDSVAPDAKAAARAQIVQTVQAGGFGHREVIVRTNAIDTPWFADDLDAAVAARPDAVLVPKISTPDQIELIGQRLFDMHANLHVRLWAMIETPAAIFNIRALAAEAEDSESRLAAFVIGTNDLAKETRARLTPGRATFSTWLALCVAAARAHGCDILDGVYNDIGDLDGFRDECKQGREMGLDGKTLIHPSQIEICNAVFAPSATEVESARAIIEAFALPENAGRGVIQLNGRMVERLHAELAERTLAIARRITAFAGAETVAFGSRA